MWEIFQVGFFYDDLSPHDIRSEFFQRHSGIVPAFIFGLRAKGLGLRAKGLLYCILRVFSKTLCKGLCGGAVQTLCKLVQAFARNTLRYNTVKIKHSTLT